MVKPERGNVSLRRLGTLGYGLYCSAEYASTRIPGPEGSPFDNDAFIGWSDAHTHLPAAQWIERALGGRTPALVTTSLATQVAAAKGGVGVALLPHFLARDAGLVCLDSDLGVDQSIYLVIQSDLAQSRRTRAVADFLKELVLANRERLSG
jgi:DNA-binding transcriptional LysR family regulator